MRALMNVKLPIDEDGHFISSREFRQLLQIMGLRPSEMPGEEDADALKEYCLQRAQPIFDRMPEKSEEEQVKKEFSKKNIVFASDLPQTNTLFMVTAHTESEYRFRLLNPKIEALQDGCEDLVLEIRDHNQRHPHKQLLIVGKIDIYEHGLEESTISGTVIHSRWRTTRRMAGRDYLITIVGLILFILLTSMLVFEVVPPAGTMHNLIDRLSTAMFTATIVSGISVYYTYRQLVPTIKWTATYDIQK